MTQSPQIPWASLSLKALWLLQIPVNFKSLRLTLRQLSCKEKLICIHYIFFLVLIPFKSLGPITLWNSEQDLYGKQNYKHCLIYICLALGNMHKSKHTECRTRERKTQMLIGLSFSLCVHLSESLDLWMVLSS